MALKIERRMEPSRTANIMVPILSIVAALVAGAVLLWTESGLAAFGKKSPVPTAPAVS